MCDEGPRVCDRGIFFFVLSFPLLFWKTKKKDEKGGNTQRILLLLLPFFFFFKFSRAHREARRHTGTRARGHDGVNDDHEENVWNRNDGPGVFRRTKQLVMWVNTLLKTKIKKVEQCASGAILSNNGRRASKHRSDAQSLFRGEGETRVRAKL